MPGLVVPFSHTPAPKAPHPGRRAMLRAGLALAGAAALSGCPGTPLEAGEFVHAPGLYEEPLQQAHPVQVLAEHAGWRIEAFARYALTALVLGVERYRFDDIAEVVPLDLALAWGPAADAQVQSELVISQSGRWFYWRTRKRRWPLPRQDLVRSMANVHIVPANARIERVLAALGHHELVALTGHLVDLEHPQSRARWRSSRTRTDSGAGACETIYVTGAQNLGPAW